MSASLQVVYVNYRSAGWLAQSVRSVVDAAAELRDLDLELTVVDNTCEVEESERLRNALPSGVRLMSATDNLGFSSGCNLGAAAGRSEHLLFLNPDTLMPAHTLRGLLDRLVEARGQVVLGPRHFADREQRFAHAPVRGVHLFDEVSDLWYDRGYAARRPLRDLAFRARVAQRTTPLRVRSVSGGCLAMGRALFEALGGWDEGFFLYSEDTDLCVRARQRGVPVLYLSFLPLIHFVEGSSRLVATRVAEARAAGRARFKRKHYGVACTGIEGLLSAVLRHGLPRRSDRWQAAIELPSTRIFRTPVADVPWAIEIGRSPLFDNCLTAFPEGPVLELPETLMSTLPPGRYFARVAAERAPGVWQESALYRYDHAGGGRTMEHAQ